jgi:glycine/D-amino acid oxidase-like deaminating enzyme
MIETKRRMPNGSVKCTRKQVQITNGNVVMYKSDDLGLATVGATTVVLAAGSWASDLEDQFILFAKENYLIAHPIVSTSTSTLTFTTTVAVANRGSQGWMVMGYPKDERIQLVDYALTYILKGEEQKDAGGETGENK